MLVWSKSWLDMASAIHYDIYEFYDAYKAPLPDVIEPYTPQPESRSRRGRVLVQISKRSDTHSSTHCMEARRCTSRATAPPRRHFHSIPTRRHGLGSGVHVAFLAPFLVFGDSQLLCLRHTWRKMHLHEDEQSCRCPRKKIPRFLAIKKNIMHIVFSSSGRLAAPANPMTWGLDHSARC